MFQKSDQVLLLIIVRYLTSPVADLRVRCVYIIEGVHYCLGSGSRSSFERLSASVSPKIKCHLFSKAEMSLFWKEVAFPRLERGVAKPLRQG